MKILLPVMLLLFFQIDKVFDYFDFIKQGHGYKISKAILESDKHNSTKKFLQSVINDPDKLYSSDDICILENVRDYYSIPWTNVLNYEAQTKNIIALNENHTIPNHRLTALEMLPILKRHGFKHIAIEGLSTYDKTIGERGYPQYMISGNYLREPNYGNFIRKAISLDFELINYDVFGVEDREYEQATNICNAVKENNIEKLFIFCGHDHIVESGNTSLGTTMVMYLEQFLSEEIFTISQTEFNCIPIKPSKPFCFEMNYILKHKDTDQYFSSPLPDRDIDISLFPQYFENEEEKWMMFEFQEFTAYKIPEVNRDFLILAFDEQEPINAVPIDVVEIVFDTKTKRHVTKPLFLPLGNYELMYLDGKDELVLKQKISVPILIE